MSLDARAVFAMPNTRPIAHSQRRRPLRRSLSHDKSSRNDSPYLEKTLDELIEEANRDIAAGRITPGGWDEE